MGKYQKLIEIIKDGESDTHIAFDDLCRLMNKLGFDERIRGSHHIFRKSGVPERTNLQREGDKAKAYQVHQIRSIILKYKLRLNQDA